MSRDEEEIMKIPVSFADLTYTQKGLASITFPLGLSYVTSYALKELGNEIEAEIFKFPKEFKSYLEKTTPKIACFSNYLWNNNLSYAFAETIKENSPNTVIVFGGPNYPLDEKEQKEFLQSYPKVDFYIRMEGEKAIVELFRTLSENDFDVQKVKKKELEIPSCNYLNKGQLVKGNLISRLKNLDEIPSPYLTGLNDKFFDGILIPAIQIARGCPFSCTYCQDGNSYFNKIARFSTQRAKEEVEYIARRIKVPSLIIVDDNFGMYREDVEISKNIAMIREKYDWPKYIEVPTGKNQTERILECATLLGGKMELNATVQSTDPVVLKNIKRNNISMEKMINLTKTGEKLGASSLGEVILCLPGDSKMAYLKSVFDLIDSEVNIVRTYQLVLLTASEMSKKESRERYGMVTRFRIFPRCFGNFELYGKNFSSTEIGEICISNNTMSYEDYSYCRLFGLTTEIFYNDGLFKEVINFLRLNNLPASKLISRVHNAVLENIGPLNEIYNGFLKESQEGLWESKSDLEKILKEAQEKGLPNPAELKDNELFKYRGVAFFTKAEDLHKVVFNEAKKLILKEKELKEDWESYLNELYEFSLLRKKNVLSLQDLTRKTFHYDFVKLWKNGFRDNPLLEFKPNGINIEIGHTNEQKELISKYIEQFGTFPDGLGHILHKGLVNRLYRTPRLIED